MIVTYPDTGGSAVTCSIIIQVYFDKHKGRSHDMQLPGHCIAISHFDHAKPSLYLRIDQERNPTAGELCKSYNIILITFALLSTSCFCFHLHLRGLFRYLRGSHSYSWIPGNSPWRNVSPEFRRYPIANWRREVSLSRGRVEVQNKYWSSTIHEHHKLIRHQEFYLTSTPF